MDRMSAIVAVVVFVVLLGLYFMKTQTTLAYKNGEGAIPTVTAAQYSADYLYKDAPAAPAAAIPDTAATARPATPANQPAGQ